MHREALEYRTWASGRTGGEIVYNGPGNEWPESREQRGFIAFRLPHPQKPGVFRLTKAVETSKGSFQSRHPASATRALACLGSGRATAKYYEVIYQAPHAREELVRAGRRRI